MSLQMLVKAGGLAYGMHKSAQARNNALERIKTQMGNIQNKLSSTKDYFEAVGKNTTKKFDLKGKSIFDKFLNERKKLEGIEEKAIAKSGGITSGEVEADVLEQEQDMAYKKERDFESLDFEEETETTANNQEKINAITALNENMQALEMDQKVTNQENIFDDFLGNLPV
jgi:hypothetical protein